MSFSIVPSQDDRLQTGQRTRCKSAFHHIEVSNALNRRPALRNDIPAIHIPFFTSLILHASIIFGNALEAFEWPPPGADSESLVSISGSFLMVSVAMIDPLLMEKAPTRIQSATPQSLIYKRIQWHLRLKEGAGRHQGLPMCLSACLIEKECEFPVIETGFLRWSCPVRL